MPERRPRKDAARNRAAALAAAADLFARTSPDQVTMADVATEAGVGKATLFRAFGDRTGLIRALHQARLEPVLSAVETGPPPLGPATPALQRVPAVLDALLCFKLDHRHLARALEGAENTSPYRAGHYQRWHELLRAMLEPIVGPSECGFTAHALLAAVRADLVERLAERDGLPRETMRAHLADFTARVLRTDPGERRT
ncbi:transcriptional regulator [Nocardiopsis sp. CNR-923]|uniref:TetR/AcrR family transcriptional regulator n=1 Tax=Nocardiopsis sp. CNR-923 TaxID=1904965 RepID=UPI00095BDAD8|nr:TetR/AcrR family transcriptional regulator [Nocardiopsis sp. CNR-923]OLT27549.1 transcriptional regulator [Nocardiopsis sp. CNR-923]